MASPGLTRVGHAVTLAESFVPFLLLDKVVLLLAVTAAVILARLDRGLVHLRAVTTLVLRPVVRTHQGKRGAATRLTQGSFPESIDRVSGLNFIRISNAEALSITAHSWSIAPSLMPGKMHPVECNIVLPL